MPPQTEYMCSSCNFPVTKEAANCPNCGAHFGKSSVGLGPAEFTWTEAFGIFALGAIAGIIGFKYLEKSGKF
jgi:predicted amidophosphoribosyltransferase